MQDSRKQFTKNNTSVEFIATTDFFIKNRITEEQIYSIHFAHLSVDDIHTKNQCSTNVGSQCKQTIDTLQNNYDYTDPAILITFVGSLYVGKYNGAPVFLKPNGEFRDFNDNKYWVSYDENITFIPFEEWSNNDVENYMNTIYAKLFQSFTLTDEQKKAIYSNVLDIDMIKKAQVFDESNQNQNQDKLFMGFSGYSRNESDNYKKIYLDYDGSFKDDTNNHFWPTYESIVKYHDKKPYAVYTFNKFDYLFPWAWSSPPVVRHYNFMNYSNYYSNVTPVNIMILFYILFYGWDILHNFHSLYTNKVTTYQEPTKLPQFSHESLHDDIVKKYHYEHKLHDAEKSGNTSEVAKYKDKIKDYKDKEFHELAMRDKNGDISISQQKTLFSKNYKHHYDHIYSGCKSSIESLINTDTVTNSTMFGSSTNYNFPSEPTSDMTKCQKDFINSWNKNEDCSPNCLYGDQSGVIGDSTKDSSSHISKLIDSVSTSHAHNESTVYTQNVMKQFTKEYDIVRNQDTTKVVEVVTPTFNTSNFSKDADTIGVDGLLAFDSAYILSENKRHVDQLTMEKEIEHKLSIFKLHLADARKIKDNYVNDDRYKNMSDEEKGKFRENLERKISNYEKVVKSIEK